MALLLLAATVGIVVGTAEDPERGEPAPWRVGSCVEGDRQLTAVRCDGPHDGRIADVTSDPDDCPGSTEGVVPDRGYIWCIDEDA